MIKVESLEIHVSYHCNLSCKGCSHMTPLESKQFINEREIFKTLRTLSKYVHCNIIRLIGGEPILNNNLASIAKEIKDINIADNIAIATNGIFIDKIKDCILENVDMIEISNYNYSDCLTNKIVNWANKAKEKYNIKTYIYMYKYFRESVSYKENKNFELVKKIYKTCIISQKWQCFNVFEGYFFKCPQAMAISKNIRGNNFNINGIKIENNPNLEKKLNKYIISDEPLKACNYCLGTVGKCVKLKQIPREKYIEYASGNIEHLVDYNFLNKCLKENIADMYTVDSVIEI